MITGSDVRYVVLIRDRSWNLVTVISDFLSIDCTIGINEVGGCTIVVPWYSDLVEAVEEQYLIEVKRRPSAGSNSHDVFTGPLESSDYRVDSNGRREYIYTFAGALVGLQWHINAYPAGTTNNSQFTATNIEDIIEAVIDENFVFGTTAGGRIRDADNTGYVQAGTLTTPGAPVSIDYYCAWVNVLDIVFDLCESAGYEIELTANTVSNRYDVTMFYTGKGSDKTAEVFLSRINGTVSTQETRIISSEEKTVAIVAGGGQRDDRVTSVRTGGSYNSSYNSSEIFIDARQTSVTSELDQIGDARLAQQVKKKRYTVQLNQVVDYVYGDTTSSDFFLGDTVKYEVNGDYSGDYRNVAASFSFRPGEKETVALTLEEA